MKLQHPEFPEITKDIEGKAAANKWLKSGWIEVKTKAAKTATTDDDKSS